MPRRVGSSAPPAKTKTPPVPPGMTAAQAAHLATIMAGRVIANMGGLQPGEAPFADQAPPTSKPAKDKYVPSLTARTAVARGRKQRKAQHGLLTPGQRAAESAATIPAATAPSFRETHDLRHTEWGDLTKPRLPHMSLQQIVNMLGIGPRGAAGAYPPSKPNYFPPPTPPVARETGVNGRDELQRNQPHQGNFLSAFRESMGGPAIGKGNARWLGEHVLQPAYEVADKGVATAWQAAGTGIGEAFNPGALRIKGGQGGLSAGNNPASKIHPISGAALAAQISMGGFKVMPRDVNVRASDVTGLIGGIPAGADTTKIEIPLNQLEGVAGWGLTPEARKRGVRIIRKNGWTDAQIEAMGGDPTTFLLMEYNKAPRGRLAGAEQLARAFGADVVSTGAQSVGALGFASEVAQGRGKEALSQYADQIHQTIPVFGKYSYAHELQAHPLFAGTAGLAAAKGVGALGHFRPGPGRERVVNLAGMEGGPVDLGHYSKNIYTQTREGFQDILRAHSARYAQHTMGQIADLAVARARSRVTPEHIDVQAPYIAAERAIPQERRADLMAIQDHGGPAVILKAVAHFRALQEAGKDVPADRLGLERLLPVIESLTPEDKAWMAAHAEIAKMTSTSMVNRGEFSDPSRVYRQYELAIEMGAAEERRNIPEGEKPDGVFTRAKEARREFQNYQDTGEPSAAWKARDAEIERDIKRHERGANTKASKVIKAFRDARATYLGQLKEWQGTRDEIKGREPPKPPKKPKPVPKLKHQTKPGENSNIRTRVFNTRSEMLETAIAVRKAHPTWKIDTRQTAEGGQWRMTVERVEPELTAAQKRAATIQAKKDAKVAENHASWTQEMKEHNAARPKPPEVPRGYSFQNGRLQVHETQARQQTARIERLRAAQEARKGDPREVVFQEYRDAVAAAVAAHHAEPGAIEPVRVARTQPPVDKSGKFRRGKNLTSNLNIQGERSEGQRALSGEYVYDTSVPLRENFDEQMTRMKTGLYNDIVSHPLVTDVTGGGEKQAKRVEKDGGSEEEIDAAREPQFVPQGFVAVPIHYPGSRAQVTVPLWERGTSIYMHEHHDPNAQMSVLKKLHDRLRAREMLPGEVVPDGERVLLIPEGLHKRLDQYAHPNDADPNFYDRFNRGYQRLLIGIYPSTWLGNAPGSVPLAIASGATHPRDYWRAFKSGPQGRISRALGIERTNDRNAATQNLGPGRSLADLSKDSRNLLMQAAETGRGFSIAGENFSSAAAWEGRARVAVDGRVPTLRKIIPGLDKVMPERMKGLAAQMSVDAATLHQALKDGKLDGENLSPELQAVQDRVIKGVTEFMSEGMKPHGSVSRMIGRAILFHHWMGHILSVTLYTLPVKYPGRAVLLNSLSMYGNQYRREHGVYPPWMAQFFPFAHRGDYTYSGGLGQLTPLASATNLAQAGTNVFTYGPNNSLLQQGINVTSPLLQPSLNALLAAYANSKLHPNERATKYVSPWDVMGAGYYYAAPGAHKFGPTSGYVPGAANFMGLAIPGTAGTTKKTYYEYISDGQGGYQKVPIPWRQRPGGQPVLGLPGAVSRIVGVPLERSAYKGKPWTYELTGANTFAYNDWINAILNPPGLAKAP